MTNIAVSLDGMGIVTNVIVVGDSIPEGFQGVSFPVKIGVSLTQAEKEYRESEARAERNALLAATDWMALSDVQMTTEMQEYRQALRDLPAQAGFPDNVTWPLKP